MPCYRYAGVTPVVHPTAYVHPTAVLIGDVIVGPGCYVGPLASLRGDFGRIVLEEGANLQDTCVIHGFPESVTRIARNGHVGHGAVLHGCQIGEDAMVGMNAVVMDEAQIAPRSIVAACAFVKAGLEIPARKLVAGMPAKVVRDLSEQEIAWKIDGTRCYQDLAVRSLATLRPCAPLTEMEAGRTRFEFPGVIPLTEVKKGG